MGKKVGSSIHITKRRKKRTPNPPPPLDYKELQMALADSINENEIVIMSLYSSDRDSLL